MDTKPGLQGRKTHEQQLRILERRDDVPDARRMEAELAAAPHEGTAELVDPDARQSEFPVSRGGVHQESRTHNKHNNQGQPGHEPQTHGEAEQGS
ncbi:hypothetical protein PQJ75_14140 [Rhodoplanes sp. TEM]|uniref:Uncharacterized protein n=1 Tax=Rhodoplanes tepidamans TaxID=200616 RepID=A0ABT5JJY4_RHOTP|nr:MULTISPECIES: hypothetical protein [Rhodoplanes]MDC7789862.1 hypothetical protein [Rhodoplanes tepidamans]MDC7984873.1 hypothetical protein [Rhodoplanes sp. TEM]MDQ0358462.1 hypothetical protein [Rhodoplanes tepidamans]